MSSTIYRVRFGFHTPGNRQEEATLELEVDSGNLSKDQLRQMIAEEMSEEIGEPVMVDVIFDYEVL